MATELHVDIVTPQASAYSGPAKEILVPGWEGQFGVLPDHDSFLALLKSGVAVVYTPAGEKRFLVGRGFAEVGDNKVTLLTDSAKLTSEIDKASAKSDLDAAQKKLAETQPFSEDWKHALAAAEHAQAALDA